MISSSSVFCRLVPCSAATATDDDGDDDEEDDDDDDDDDDNDDDDDEEDNEEDNEDDENGSENDDDDGWPRFPSAAMAIALCVLAWRARKRARTSSFRRLSAISQASCLVGQ